MGKEMRYNFSGIVVSPGENERSVYFDEAVVIDDKKKGSKVYGLPLPDSKLLKELKAGTRVKGIFNMQPVEGSGNGNEEKPVPLTMAF